MQTNFSLAQLADPDTAEAESILRTCVHCGFCTATCPTFVLLGDELDSPRGRIYLIKEMLEADRPADAETVLHVDRCLSCLSCMTTCPSGVHYMHLVDHARAHVEETYVRPLPDRLLRALLVAMLPDRSRFRAALALALFGKPFAPLLDRLGPTGRRLAAMLRLAPAKAAAPSVLVPGRTIAPAAVPARGRVALLTGCAQPGLRPEINEATVRLLGRLGVTVVLPPGEGCCGSLAHHMGREAVALTAVRRNVDAWTAVIEDGGLDAILVTASGCGTTIKDYGHMLRGDPAYAAKAARVSALARDVTEYLSGLALPAVTAPAPLTVAYHSACSMQHGQRVREEPKALLRRAGFTVRDVPEGHLCCGSAGTYNILQPEIATRLRDRKLANVARVAPDVIATGNIGCITQLGAAAPVPVVHTVELLDWAHGGPAPAEIATR
ncbi:glycolate oxidase subunit GlcF [Oharaeibacter diazotrophicus]|uniref:Glycolate oxidase iron-sulfur subunit n=3 Tax=Oharaeibacter diazotrophicus TaxID=1920512 RepID=A0A4R6RBG3_9HYPH|nr:glycolate oxidase subunit GlcF [Oharaeibacter diazotrophicus]TDP83481.1 glycolate oxidase iron-sulfur subunit [Oharaeibacter diazotrophicus]BBE72313.1 lactate utilization protein A [Pleomorphomonas sp. SM30]GLS79083.1 glycolate oxidase iron-sulfur subunit [Oharaeibacter diazotrophicus]